MQHEVLYRKAVDHGYPLVVLRLSLASYRWGRFILFDLRLVSVPIYPIKGIIAGSTCATFELCCYTLDGIRAVRDSGSRAKADTHVDDVCLAVLASSLQELASNVSTAFAALYYEFTVVLGLTFAASKAFLLASSKQALEVAQRTLRHSCRAASGFHQATWLRLLGCHE